MTMVRNSISGARCPGSNPSSASLPAGHLEQKSDFSEPQFPHLQNSSHHARRATHCPQASHELLRLILAAACEAGPVPVTTGHKGKLKFKEVHE